MPGRILSLLWTNNDGKDSKAEKTPPPDTTAAKPLARPPVVVGSVNGAPASVVSQEDPAVREQLEKAMLSDGDNSVARFREVVASLVDDVPDSVARVRVAFKASGLTPGAVIADLASDERILATKQAEFRTFIEGKRASGLGAKQKAVDENAAEVATATAQIEELQRKIVELKGRQGQLEEALRAEARQYAEVEARFEQTLAAIRAERQSMLSTVQQYSKK